jgi:dTDP-glucose 4,6-dehydratase
MIKNIIAQKPLPLYGRGDNIRDWIYVEDHTEAIDLILHKGTVGETYALGGNNEMKNLDLVNYLIQQLDQKLKRPKGSSLKLIEFVTDRLGHDYRYAIDASKIEKELGWKAFTSFEKGMDKTLEFYLSN